LSLIIYWVKEYGIELGLQKETKVGKSYKVVLLNDSYKLAMVSGQAFLDKLRILMIFLLAGEFLIFLSSSPLLCNLMHLHLKDSKLDVFFSQ